MLKNKIKFYLVNPNHQNLRSYGLHRKLQKREPQGPRVGGKKSTNKVNKYVYSIHLRFLDNWLGILYT